MHCDFWLPLIKDIVIIITGLVASVVAILGLNTWRRQLYGQSEYDVARRLLKNLYLFRDVINNARHVLMVYSATPDLPKEKLEKLSDKEKEWYAIAQAFEKRCEPVAKARAKLDADILESEVFWGNKIKDNVKQISELHAEWMFAVEEHLEKTNPREPDKNYFEKEAKRNRAIIFGRSNRTKDDFQDRMLTAVEKIEILLKPYIIKKEKIKRNKKV